MAIGLTVTLGHLGAVGLTGASMNPARTFGTAVIRNAWNNHWIYWVGPMLGGIGASLLYTQVLSAPEDETVADKYRTSASDKEVFFEHFFLFSFILQWRLFSDEAARRLLKLGASKLIKHFITEPCFDIHHFFY